VIEKFLIMKLVIDAFNNNRTFLLENVLIRLNGFVLVIGEKMLLGTISWMGREIIFYQ
jgi:hypothetical protein